MRAFFPVALIFLLGAASAGLVRLLFVPSWVQGAVARVADELREEESEASAQEEGRPEGGLLEVEELPPAPWSGQGEDAEQALTPRESQITHKVRPLKEEVPEEELPPAGQRVRAAQVLRWAEQEAIPRARFREESGELPAGLEMEGGSAWIPSLREGDRLVSVDGVAVHSVEAVVTAVHRARRAAQPEISAVFARPGRGRTLFFSVQVEQPYPH